MKMLSSFGSLVDRLCVIIGAFLSSQIPPFIQQYTQHLAGHVDELQHLLNELHTTAAYANKNLQQYIQKFISHSDPDVVHQGEFMQKILYRWEDLHQTLYHLTHSSLWARPYLFLKDLQYDIAQSTFASFQPAIQLNIEGLCYALLGMLVGWTFYQILSKCITFGYSCAMANFKQNI